MKLDFLLLAAFVAAVVLIGARLGFGRHREAASWGKVSRLRALTDTGSIFILIGALTGPQLLNLLSAEFVDELSPILMVGFGGIGFLYGSHFEWRRMRRFSRKLYYAGFAQSCFSLLVVAFVTWFALPLLHQGATPALRLTVALALGICAGGTAPAGVFLLAGTRDVRHADIQALRFFSAIDDLPPILVLGIVFSAVYPLLIPSPLAGWQRLVLAVGTGVLMGAVTHWVFPDTGDVRHNTLMLFGMAASVAGAAALLQLSPLFVSVIAGMVFANLSPRKESAYGLLASRERTLYAVFLLVAGAMFRFAGTRVLLVLVPVYVVVRGLAKVAGGYLSRQLFLRDSRISKRIGAGLLFQGGMPLVMAVHFEHSLRISLTFMVMTTFVLAVFINDLAATPIASALLRHPRAK